MPTNSEVEMSPAEVDTHLSRHETGVLALARDDAPYAIPISYGYDADDRALYLRLVSTPDSEKREFLASTPEARVVVYDDEDDEYASVVGVGTLERVDLGELTPETIAQYGEARRPLFEIWADDKPDLDIELYRFNPETLTGRTVVVERDGE
ncbi:pyridoxamine 5'-phosphate oxidase family protein [Halorubrum tropicale]|uniref:Pyridoxamine 5-phosphate oxidase n=1 Tax=Halorubrum tropicale TaxID=1765655 RepID=A0A0N0BRF2_9EURY|nr:pyridoxamine 5'-phosphate oxidase family protein [Halorubrum tropicale]KOX96763.1 pyridoxamine 5-phosphate oxidase [Halorubrum tropicale]